MKNRRMYWRKNGKSIVLEGRTASNKPLLIWTLLDANAFYSKVLQSASFLPSQKVEKIREKVMRLTFKADKEAKSS